MVFFFFSVQLLNVRIVSVAFMNLCVSWDCPYFSQYVSMVCSPVGDVVHVAQTRVFPHLVVDFILQVSCNKNVFIFFHCFIQHHGTARVPYGVNRWTLKKFKCSGVCWGFFFLFFLSVHVSRRLSHARSNDVPCLREQHRGLCTLLSKVTFVLNVSDLSPVLYSVTCSAV